MTTSGSPSSPAAGAGARWCSRVPAPSCPRPPLPQAKSRQPRSAGASVCEMPQAMAIASVRRLLRRIREEGAEAAVSARRVVTWIVSACCQRQQQRAFVLYMYRLIRRDGRHFRLFKFRVLPSFPRSFLAAFDAALALKRRAAGRAPPSWVVEPSRGQPLCSVVEA